MESIKIAEKLESVYPEPSLRLDVELHGPVTEAVTNLANVVFLDGMAISVRNNMTEISGPWFAEDRKKRFGVDLDTLSAQKGGETAWKPAEAPGGPFERLVEVLTQHRKDYGPFVLGSVVSYGDFVAASLFEMVERVDARMYERLIGFDQSFKRLHSACRTWLERDD